MFLYYSTETILSSMEKIERFYLVCRLPQVYLIPEKDFDSNFFIDNDDKAIFFSNSWEPLRRNMLDSRSSTAGDRIYHIIRIIQAD